MRKLTATLSAIVLTIVACLGLAACGKNGDTNGDTTNTEDTYKGEVSENTYTTKEQAAQAFFDNEVNDDGNFIAGGYEATYTSYQKVTNLSQSQINNLNLTDEQKASVTGAEKGKVNYSVNKKDSSDTTSQSNTLYVLQTASGYNYYTPLPEVGESLTKSYFESVTNKEYYTNCTVNGTLVIDGVTAPNVYKMTQDSFYSVSVGYDDNGSSTQAYTVEQYAINENGALRYFGRTTKQGETAGAFTEVANPQGISEFSEFIDGQIKSITLSQFGYTCFIKSTNGFILKEFNLVETYEVTLKNGKLSEINMNMEGGNGAKYTYSSYGTTTITIPDEITALLQAN